MKKTYLILITALAVFQLNSYSQDVRVGVAGGITISDISSPNNEMNHGVKTGLMGGILLDMPLCSNVIFQPQLSYVQKGNLQMEDANQKVYNALRYAEFTANFLYNFTVNKNVSLYLGAGPSIAFNVPSKRVTDPKEGDSFYDDILFGKTPENDFKGFDYGANFVGGIRFNNSFFLSFTYNLGLRDLNAKTDEGGDQAIKNKYFGIQFGYIFKN